MPLRIFLISSTLCIPSGGFGFFGLMYKSRCRPREEDVKDWWQNGQLRSLGTDTFAGVWNCASPWDGESVWSDMTMIKVKVRVQAP